MNTHLAERLFTLRSVFGKAAFLQGTLPRTEAFEFNGHVSRSTALIVLRMDFGALLEQSKNADLIPTYYGPMKRGETGVITRIWTRTVLEKYFDRERVALIGGPHEGGVSGRIAFVDRDGLMKEI
jgi:hypothetical protein